MTRDVYPGFPAPKGFGTIPVDELTRHTGLELLQRMVAGDFPQPPISEGLRFGMTEATEGRVVFKGMPTASHFNPLGGMHGGWTSAIMDSALACCVWTTLAKGEGYTTVEFKVNLIRPVQPDVEVTCEGLVVSRGRTIAVSEARLFGPDGKVLAFGTETCTIFPLEKLFRG